MFDVTNWVACLNGENGPGGTPSHEALLISSQGALEISSVAGQPHCLRLPSNGSPSQGDPKNQAMPLPDHGNSPRLARDALVLGPSAALN